MEIAFGDIYKLDFSASHSTSLRAGYFPTSRDFGRNDGEWGDYFDIAQYR